MLTDTQMQHIETLAKALGGVEWEAVAKPEISWPKDDAHLVIVRGSLELGPTYYACDSIAEIDRKSDSKRKADYIAAVSPAVILALVEELRRLRLAKQNP